MTKKEQLELDSLREQVAEAQNQTRIAMALRFTDEVKPDVPAPISSYSATDGLSKGFLFNAYIAAVAPACSSSAAHNYGNDTKTATQYPRILYSTRLLALRGLRHAVELECAKRLAAIDKQIEKELANQ